jgi:basic amino acid/polyamine antiporter, APA family
MTEQAPQLKREMGLFSAVMLVTGMMIGSGIFIVSADIGRQIPSPGWMLLVWVFTALVTLCGAASYGKLALAFPQAGGQYNFLKQAWGEIPAFLYGWALFFVVQTGSLAAVAVAFCKFLGVLIPSVSSKVIIWQLAPGLGLSSQQAVAISVLMTLTAYNCFGLKQGAMLQNIFTVLKVAAVLGLIAIGFFGVHGQLPTPEQWSFSFTETPVLPLFCAFAVSSVGSLFSSDSWNNVTFMGAEIHEPEKNLPRALIYGPLLVLGLYLLVNIAYLNMIPFSALQHASEDRVATTALTHILGAQGAAVMASVILISTFGCLNGFVLAGARAYYSMAKDGLFFKSFAYVHPQSHTPVVSLLGQGVFACVLAVSGSYGQLLDYTIFTNLLFYALTVMGLLKLAASDPVKLHMTRWTDYIVPVLYIVLVLYIAGNLAVFKQHYTLPGLMLVLSGLPIYFIWKRFYPNAHAL